MSDLRILQPGDEHLLEAFLKPRMAESMFLLGNLRQAGLVDRGERLQGTYAGAFEVDRLVGVVAHFWNGVLVPQAPSSYLESLWRATVTASERAVAGVSGPAEQADTILDTLGLHDPSLFKLNIADTLYELSLDDLTVPELLRSDRAHVRRGKRDEQELLTQWRVAYDIEAVGEPDNEPTRRQCRERVVDSLERERLWVLEVDGQPSACCEFNAVLSDAVRVGGVYTPPASRNCGYGRSVVAGALRNVHDDGVETAMLFADDSNPSAQRAYEALGFEPIGHYKVALLHETIAPLST